MQEIRKCPKISVIIAVYNQASILEEAVSSVLGQTYKNLEVIIIDDASQDNSAEIIKKLAQKDIRIKAIYNNKNIGILANKRKAFNFVTGKYCTILDGDDFWIDRRKIERQVAFLEDNSAYIMTGGQVIIVDKYGEFIRGQKFPLTDMGIRRRMLIKNSFGASTVMFRMDLAKKLGGFPTDADRIEDIALWLELGKYGKFHNSEKLYLAHRMTGFNIGEIERREQIKSVIKRIKKYKNYYPNYWVGFIKLSLEYYSFALPPQIINLIRKIKHYVFENYARG